MDFNILYFIDKLHNGVLDKIMIFFTSLGDAGIFWIILALILIGFKKTRKCGILILISLFIGVILGNGIIKNLIQRQRPCWIDNTIELLIKNPSDYSFPSGHTLASFEAAVMIYLHNKKWGMAALILALTIAFSRLYLFVHFPSDVLAGALLGTCISYGVYYGTKKMIEKRAIKE